MRSIMFILGGLLMVTAVGMLLALPTMLLWNYLMPVVFGLVEITFWQAIAMNVLLGILFKSNVVTKNK